MKLRYIYFLLCGTIASILLLTASASSVMVQESDNSTIIKFSHKLHTSMIECAGCHTNVPATTSLKERLLPKKEDCALCHDVSAEDQCGFCHYENIFEPLVPKKTALIYNHQLHVEGEKLECVKCHHGLDTVEYSSQLTSFVPQMNVCYECHNDNTVASNNCAKCHASTADLLPVSHKQNDYERFHKFSAKQPNADCAMCHDNNSCESCHVGTSMLTAANNAKDFYAPLQTEQFVDGAKQQALARAHDLNYRYSHGIDLKGKNRECQTCHQVETFCVECHSAAGNEFALGGVVPSSHVQGNFLKIGAGSGGGEHALLARRDIESCIACHDNSGGDPVCVACHSDRK